MRKLTPFFEIKYLFILPLFLFGLTSAAQQSNNSVSDLYKTWYEWPHENSNGNTVYKTTAYLPVPGIDKQDEPFSKLIINSDGSFVKTQYCGYCPAVKLEENKGSAEIKGDKGTVSSLNIKYGSSKKTSELTVVSLSSDKLVIDFLHTLNTK